jgi:hypothetical protein
MGSKFLSKNEFYNDPWGCKTAGSCSTPWLLPLHDVYNICTWQCKCSHTDIYTCMHTYKHTYIIIQHHKYIQLQAHKHTNTHTYTYLQTYIRMYYHVLSSHAIFRYNEGAALQPPIDMMVLILHPYNHIYMYTRDNINVWMNVQCESMYNMNAHAYRLCFFSFFYCLICLRTHLHARQNWWYTLMYR